MKRSKRFWITLSVLLVIVFCVAIILIFYSHLLGAEMRKIVPPTGIAPKYRRLSFDVYETDSRYVVTIDEDYFGAEGYGVEFSKDRKCLAYYGIVPKKSIDMEKFLGKDIQFLERRLGKKYLELGSGVHMIGYITADGYLNVFNLEHNEFEEYVSSVKKVDLFSGEYISEIYPKTGR